MNNLRNWAWKVFEFLASLKLAVLVLLSLVFSLATATTLESLYDTATAKYFVYQSWWFHVLLGFLGMNILCSALIRWPWKSKHNPFLMAHLGILILLFGSWVTDRYGLDGNLRVSEGETTNEVDLDSPLLVLTEGEHTVTIPVRWIPPGVKFDSISVKKAGLPYDLVVDQFISHADTNFSFVPNPTPIAGRAKPALRLKLTGGPMRITQDFWLWAGDPGWSGFQAGPAWLELIQGGSPARMPSRSTRGPRFSVFVNPDGTLQYRAESSEGKLVTGKVGKDKIAGTLIDPQWKGNVRLELAEWIPDATVFTDYKPSRMQYGNEAPPSAIHIVAQGEKARTDGSAPSKDAQTWLGIGTRAIMHSGSHEVEIGYFNRRIILPFQVRLDRFTVDHYEGSMKPSAYSSRVTVLGGRDGKSVEQTISMNEPLQNSGITLYQASYEDGDPRPVTSILSVNRDPGRPWKYTGSLLIVLGTIWLFARKYRRNSQPKRKPA